MRRVEGDAVAKTELRRQGIHLVPRNALAHTAVRIDCSSDSSVGIAQEPPAVLNRPHPSHVQVLPGRARVAIPTIVADVHQHFGAVARQLAHFVGEHSLIADEYAVPMTPAVLRVEHENPVVASAREG